MNSDDGRPEWAEVNIGNLLADPERLRITLENLTQSTTYWRHAAEEARALVILLEGELARWEEAAP